jgi:hypothetical protein
MSSGDFPFAAARASDFGDLIFIGRSLEKLYA